MTRIIFTGITFFCMFFLTGCATIMSHGPQTIPILTHPDGAECEIIDVAAGKSIVKAKTPHTATLERGDGYFQKKYYNITLSKEGYVTEKVSIVPELNPWYIGNLLFGGIPGMLIVDPLTGSMWRFEEKEADDECRFNEDRKGSFFPLFPGSRPAGDESDQESRYSRRCRCRRALAAGGRTTLS